ncbi:TRAP transporter small permease subunit [Roseivivax sp.]
MQRLLSLIDRLSRLAETAAVALVFGYCALMLIEVLARARAQSLSYTWEFSQYAMAAIFALAAGPALRHAVHVRITLVGDRLPAPARRWLDLAANAAGLAIVALMAVALWTKTTTSFSRDILATTVTQTPLWIPQAVVLWGMTQLWLDLFARLVRRAQGLPHEWRDADAEPGHD